MALKKSILSGIVAFVVATLVARAVGGKRLATGVGVLAGGSVAVSTWLSAAESDVETHLEDEASVAE